MFAMIVNRLTFLLPVFTVFHLTLAAQTIADARLQPLGETVTVRGMVTSGAELGKIRYLQDGSAGIAAYPGAGSVAGFDANVSPGDSIEVTGILVSFHGLLEITPITAFHIFSSNNPLPAPKQISVGQISDALESQVLEFGCATFGNAGGVFNNSGAYDVVDSEGETAKVYLRGGHPLVGSNIPVGPVRLRAILSKYDDFQLLPRSPDDFEQASCIFFTQKLEQSNIGTTGFAVSWGTNLPTLCQLRIGTTPVPDIVFPVTGQGTAHEYVFESLAPGTVYWVQVEAQHNGETLLSEPMPFTTQSLSSGQVKVFFNHDIDHSYANGYVPDGESFEEVLGETIARIDAAQQTIDVAMYNNNRFDITNALKAAAARGVQLRYIAALDASNPALDPAPIFPVLYGNSSALMHNKFMVIDADLTDQAWVMGGSLNWTNQNITNDFNNTLFIQDQSLARAYRIEFEEMWGGSEELPNPAQSRFGAAKRDNTPHQFVIGGHLVESYFSPSDQTTSQLESVLRSAGSEALFATFSFTKNELADALLAQHNLSVPVRGIMENISDSGAEYNYLLSNGVNIRHHNLSGEFHHKYAVVDAHDLSSDPIVATGSHNWSFSAETANDENTLILHDPALAALFKAEFEKRWGEFPLSVSSYSNIHPFVFPNPARNLLVVNDLPEEDGVILVKNLLGETLLQSSWTGGFAPEISVAHLQAGQYFVSFVSPHAVSCVPFQKI